jgi:hypothetical protein
MEIKKEIILKMIKFDDCNVKCQLQLIQLFVKVMQQNNGNNFLTS